MGQKMDSMRALIASEFTAWLRAFLGDNGVSSKSLNPTTREEIAEFWGTTFVPHPAADLAWKMGVRIRRRCELGRPDPWHFL